jgi:hypothetical protein
MSGRTEDRLRATTAAIGETIRPEDIPALRLDQRGRQFASTQSPYGRWRGGRWLIPLVAAASVATLVTGVAVAGQVLHLMRSLSRPQTGTSAAASRPVQLSAGTPKFIVTSLGGAGSVNATATGRLIARIEPPVDGFAIEGIGAAPGDHMFVLTGQGPHGLVELFRVHLGANGKPGRAVRLPGPSVRLPPSISSNGLISIPAAVSPNGDYVAYAISRQPLGDAASQPATITVVRVADGASRTWRLWPAGRTQISELSWAKGGQLSWIAVIGDATVANGSVVRHRGDALSVAMVLGTALPGRSLTVDSRLVSYGWLSEAATGKSAVLDGPLAGVITRDGDTVAAQILTEHGTRSKLVAMSSANGQITRVLLDGPRSSRADPVGIDGDSLLFTLSPRHEHPNSNYVCGHLALAKLSTAKIVQLPFEIYCSTVWPGEPFIYAW